MPFGLTERERIQAYLDKIREADPRFKGVDDSVLGEFAPNLWDAKSDSVLKSRKAGDPEYDSLTRLRKVVPKPAYDSKQWDDITDRGSWVSTALRGALEGIDPIGAYRPLYSTEDANSKTRMGGALVGGLGTAFIPVAGWMAKAAQATRLANAVKTAKGARTAAGVLRGTQHGINAAQAASAYESDRKQMGLDFDPASYLAAAGVGGAGSWAGMKSAGKVGKIAAMGKMAPAIATSQAQMATNPYLERDMPDVPAPFRGVGAIARGISEAPDAGSALYNTVMTAGLPLGFAALGYRAGKTPYVDPPIAKRGGGTWDLNPVSELDHVDRPAAVTPAQGGVTAAPAGPPEHDFTPRSSFPWDESTATDVRKQSTLFNIRRAVEEAREGSSGLKTNLIDEDGSEIMMVKHAGSDMVTVARPGEPPQMIGVDVARKMNKSVLLPFTKDGIATPLPRGFMPGATEGQMQARGFDRNGRTHFVIANSVDNPTDPTVIVFEPIDRTFTVGPKSQFPEAANIWRPPEGPTPEQNELAGRAREVKRSAAPFNAKGIGVGDIRASLNKRLTALGYGELE